MCRSCVSYGRMFYCMPKWVTRSNGNRTVSKERVGEGWFLISYVIHEGGLSP